MKSVLYLQEAAIDDYFKPIDKEAEVIVKMQLDGEEKTMKEMMATMQRQALIEKAEAEALANTNNSVKKDEECQQEPASPAPPKQAQIR